ncbi:MAG: peptide chain release factor N(5)-glutamine methyltransferase [Bacteroidota bacterium]
MPLSIRDAHQQFIQSLDHLYGLGEAKSMARIVFEDEFQIRNFQRQDILNEKAIHHLNRIRDRLLAEEPLQYILGMADFYGHRFQVNPSVLIPRQETEELVAWLVALFRDGPPMRLLDIGTGSGCIAISLKKELPQMEVVAIDKSEAALQVAQANAQFLNVDVDFRRSDILDHSAWVTLGPFDLVVSNPPYIPDSEKVLMPKHVLAHEPDLALFVNDADALLFYKTIAQFAKEYCKRQLFFECNEYNAQELLLYMQEMGFGAVDLRKDMQGKDRMMRIYLT